MEIRVRLGASSDGRIRALDLYTLSNTGAYGEHGPTTVGLSGRKSIPLYTGSLEAFRFSYDVVYTNLQPAGAYRGYGATQGIFAVESAVNELAERLGIDPTVLRDRCMVREGMTMPAYYNEPASACALDRCMAHCREMFDWEHRYPVRDMGNGKVRAAGVAMAMQGSAISGVDVGSATVKLGEDGTYNLIIGAADMGTGCDTILAQMAAEMSRLPGGKHCRLRGGHRRLPLRFRLLRLLHHLRHRQGGGKGLHRAERPVCRIAADLLGCAPEDALFEGDRVRCGTDGRTVSMEEVAYKSQAGNTHAAESTATHSSPVSPRPSWWAWPRSSWTREPAR